MNRTYRTEELSVRCRQCIPPTKLHGVTSRKTTAQNTVHFTIEVACCDNQQYVLRRRVLRKMATEAHEDGSSRTL
jgi:hypothetical protein